MMQPVLRIDYSPETLTALESLYDLRENGKGEDEDEAEVCRDAIEENPGGYTAWQQYWTTRKAKEDRQESTGDPFVQTLLESTPKNYQIWNHLRQVFHRGRSSIEDELKQTMVALEDDEKNYHAWAHRQAVLKDASPDAFIQERSVLDVMLDSDARNNSAWTQRWWLTERLPQDRSSEFDWVLPRLRKTPMTVGGWNYLYRLVLRYLPEKIHEAVAFAHEVLKTHSNCLPCLEFLAEMYFALAHAKNVDTHNRRRCLKSTKDIWSLCQKLNPIRRHYWSSRIRHVQMLSTSNAHS